MFATAMGTDLASQSCVAETTPLPRKLCGVRVTADGEDLPLLYVGPAQINFQLSYLTGFRHVTVTRDSLVSNKFVLHVLSHAPGIFMFDSAPGRNLAAAQLGDYSLLGPGNALRIPSGGGLAPGNVVVLYVQGLGTPITGDAAPVGDVYRSAMSFTAPMLFLDGALQPAAQILYAGSAPGMAIQQINWAPDTGTAAGAHTVHICTSETCSQDVTVFMTRTGSYVAGNVQAIDDGDGSVVHGRAGGQTLAIDRNGNFLADWQGELKLEFLGVPTLYNWRKNVSVSGPTVLSEAVQMFRVVTDRANPYDFHREITPDWNTRLPEMVVWTEGSSGLDLLDHLYWAFGSYWCGPGTLTRIPDGVLPKKVFVPPQADAPAFWQEAISDAVSHINAATGRTIYAVVGRAPNADEAGYTFRLSPIGGAVFHTSGAGGCGDAFNIPVGTILIDPDQVKVKAEFTGTAEHELHHGLGQWPHARPPAYLMNYIQDGNDVLTSMERQADSIAFRLRPGTDLGLYDKRPE
jgi:uncharacterized protein (TIGR03437 family)